MQDTKRKYKKEYSNLRIDIETREEYYGEKYTYVSILGDKQETDEEFQSRLVYEFHYYMHSLNFRRQQYENLKKEFDGE